LGKELYVGGGPDSCGVREERTGVKNIQSIQGFNFVFGGEFYVGKAFGLVAEAKYEQLPSILTTLGNFDPSNYSVVIGVRYHIKRYESK
jgi:hypothetical protein